MKSINATNLVNVFNGTCNFGTLLGAFLCDTYLGRYKTLGIASISSFTVQKKKHNMLTFYVVIHGKYLNIFV